MIVSHPEVHAKTGPDTIGAVRGKLRGWCPKLAVLGVVALAVAGCGGKHSATAVTAPATTKTPAAALRGLVPKPLPSTPHFTLADTAGRPFDFASRARNKLTFLYFGYTHCPDVCPLTMADIAIALRKVRPSVRRRVQVVFVTVDPRRDTPRVLRAWLDRYNRSFIGLTGTEQAIRAAALAAGVPLPPPPTNRKGSYGVSHAAFVLPYSPDGRAHVVYAEGFSPADYAHDMPLLLRL
ncbi:MAG: SCO family protein [Gaiellaceae bacterium]